MAGKTKIQNEDEIVRWILEGKSYGWMVDEYRRKYGIETSESMFGNLRAKKGLPRRITRDDELIPWRVKPEHAYHYPVMMLRLEARRRAGIRTLSEKEEAQLDGWLGNMDPDAVVHYDPDTKDGWFYVPRREGVDTDLIRVPSRKTTTQRNKDAMAQ